MRSYHERAAKYYLSLDDDPEHVLEAAYHFDKAGKKEESAEVIINNASDLIAKGFWEKIEDRLQSAIKSFRLKTQPQAIKLVAMANLQIGRLYQEKGDYDLALHHAGQSLSGFRKIKENLGIFNSNNQIAGIYYYKKEVEKAKEYNEKNLKMAEKHKNDYWKAGAMENLGTLILDEDMNKSLDYYLKSLKFFENENTEIHIANACTNIANVYAEMGNYEKSYEYIKRALELRKERNAIYDIAKTKINMADIYYKDPKKPVSVDSIINCLKEGLETYEKIGHVRGIAEVHTLIGTIYRSEKDFKSAVANYQEAATIYSSLNQQSEEAKVNAIIGVCHIKLKDFTNAKSCFEKNLLSGHCDIGDELSLVEIYLNNGDYNVAFDLSNKLTTDDADEISDDKRYVALLFSSISSVLLNKEDDAYNYLKEIGEFDSQKYNINWDFSDIEPVLDKIGESKQFFIDAVTLLKGDVNYPIIRLEDVKIIRDETEKQAEIFHPFTGSFTITKEDEKLKDIMQKLNIGQNQKSEVLNVVNIFISYSEDDGKDLAEKLKRALEGLDTEISAFVAAEDIDIGVSWEPEIITALSDCDVFIPILTVAACRSNWVQKEIGVAIEKETRTIPCVYKPVLPNEIPDIIADLQRITFKNEYDLTRQVLALFTPSENDQRIKKPKKSEGSLYRICNNEKINFDTPEILGIKRNKALLILGFLFSKGFLDCKNLDEQKFDLKLTESGLKIKI